MVGGEVGIELWNHHGGDGPRSLVLLPPNDPGFTNQSTQAAKSRSACAWTPALKRPWAHEAEASDSANPVSARKTFGPRCLLVAVTARHAGRFETFCKRFRPGAGSTPAA